MAIDVLLGLQWGDEGKGKIVDYLADRYSMVCRFQGGPNAGHTLYINGEKEVLHTIPSGIFHPHLTNIIGNGVVIDPVTLNEEISKVSAKAPDVLKRLKISKKAHLILPTHKMLDMASEASKGEAKIGSTLRGIGPCYMDKTGRNGFRIGDILSSDWTKKYETLKEKHFGLLKQYPPVEFTIKGQSYTFEEMERQWLEALEKIRSLTLIDAEYEIHETLSGGEHILAEGAQGAMLDIDFGTYPFVTSSNTITAGVCSGLGVAPRHIRDVIGVTKAYCTRVGSGPFPSELTDEVGQRIRDNGGEYGSTTGRPRRCGWLDIPQLKYAVMITGTNHLAITKLDILNDFEQFETVHTYKVGEEFTQNVPFDLEEVKGVSTKEHKGWMQSMEVDSCDNLPQSVKNYLAYLEKEIGVPVTYVSTGPGREQLLVR